jgi:hypothetical protein
VQIVGLYPIICSCGLDDSMVDLYELIGIAEAIILVDVPGLKFICPDNLPERWSKSTKPALPDGVTSIVGECRGGDGDLAL